jgi:hypothetical protein
MKLHELTPVLLNGGIIRRSHWPKGMIFLGENGFQWVTDYVAGLEYDLTMSDLDADNWEVVDFKANIEGAYEGYE